MKNFMNLVLSWVNQKCCTQETNLPYAKNFLSIEEVGTEEISVREVVNKLSLVGGQGFRKCNCSKKCTTKMCLC